MRIIAFDMSRDLMGIRESELVGGLECGGVAADSPRRFRLSALDSENRRLATGPVFFSDQSPP